MNSLLIAGLLIVGYAAIIGYIYSDYRKACKNMNVKYNGYKWIVRDKKGKFVKMPKNNIQGFFTVCMFAYEVK